MDVTGSLWDLQDFSSCGDLPGGTIDDFFDSVGHPGSHLSLLSGSSQSCLDPAALSEPLEQPLEPSGIGPSSDVLSDEANAIGSGPNPYEDMQFADLMNGGDGMGSVEGMDLEFSTDTTVPAFTDSQSCSKLIETPSGEASGQAIRSLQAKIEIDGVGSSTVSSIMEILWRSNAKVRLETRDSQG